MTGLEPFHPLTVLLIAALNPVVIAVAFLMGRAADQAQKIVVAAFAAALAGSLALWIATFAGLVSAKGIGGEGGVFVLQCLFGLVWSGIGFAARPKDKNTI